MHFHGRESVYYATVLKHVCLYALCILCFIGTSYTAVSGQTTDKIHKPHITLAGALNLKDIHTDGSALVYDDDTHTGAILHDAFFTVDGTAYVIRRIEVTADTFFLRITRNGEETDETSVLAGRYIVFKREFSAVGYIDANTLTAHPTYPNTASVPLASANGLRKDDFLSHLTFEITNAKPFVDRYPEKIQPLPVITRHFTDKPITLRLTEYYRDPESTRLSFYASLDGACCVVHHSIQEDILTLTPIGTGTTAVQVKVYDAPGYMETGTVEIEILPDSSLPAEDTTPPVITNEEIIGVPSDETPSITITIDHQAYAGENLQITFDGPGACGQLSSDTIEGTSVDKRPVKPVYSGVLTGDSTETSPATHGYKESEQAGNLTPTTLEMGGAVYRITELLYSKNQITLRIEKDAAKEKTVETEVAKKYPDLSGHYLILKNKDSVLTGYAPVENPTENQETFTIPLNTASPLRNRIWFDGTVNTAMELTVNKPEEIRTIPPQTYTTTVKGPPGIYSGCTLTVKDTSGNKTKKPAPLSMFTILHSEKEKEAEYRRRYPKVYAPIVPEQQTPKKPWSLLIAHKEKEGAKKLLHIGELALQLASPDISTSSVQKVDLGRMSYIPEVRDLQIFLNLAGYNRCTNRMGIPRYGNRILRTGDRKSNKSAAKRKQYPCHRRPGPGN